MTRASSGKDEKDEDEFATPVKGTASPSRGASTPGAITGTPGRTISGLTSNTPSGRLVRGASVASGMSSPSKSAKMAAAGAAAGSSASGGDGELGPRGRRASAVLREAADWVELFDVNTMSIYYRNNLTGKTRKTMPEEMVRTTSTLVFTFKLARTTSYYHDATRAFSSRQASLAFAFLWAAPKSSFCSSLVSLMTTDVPAL